jgi:hypothetical protein
MSRLALMVVVALLAGCGPAWRDGARAMSVSQMPCTEDQVVVREVQMNYSSWTWDAKCKGVDYLCTSVGPTTTCRPVAQLAE